MCLLDASSGNLGCSLAYYSRFFGYQTFVVSSSKLTASKKEFMEFYGAKVHMVGNFTIEGNHFCREMAGEEPNKYCFLDQLHNWNNPRAHYETTAPEILKAFPDLSLVVGSLGSGGSLLGTAQYIKEHAPQARVVAVQAAPGTRLPGTASLSDGDYVTPFIEKGFREKLFDDTYKVSEVEAAAAALRLRDQGIFCGLQTGGVFSAAEHMLENQRVLGKVVVLSGDSGWKNMDKLLLANRVSVYNN
jgi:cysteine synthase